MTIPCQRMMSIFIGSSTEKKDLAKKIAQELANRNYHPLRWWEELSLGSITLDGLLEISREVDGAVFIFGEDDKTWCRYPRAYARGT